MTRRTELGSGASSVTADPIEVHVGSLEFEGLRVPEPARVQAAFQGELSRLVTEQGLPERAHGVARASLDGGTLTEADLGSPEGLGRAVARHVYAELAR